MPALTSPTGPTRRTPSSTPAVRSPRPRAALAAVACALVASLAACSTDAGGQPAAVQQTHVAGATSTTPPPSTDVSTPEPTTPEPTTAPPTSPPVPTPSATPSPTPTVEAVVLLRRGDSGAKVRSLQARLRQIGWFSGDVSDLYGSRTETAVRGFQAKRGYTVTGSLDEPTWDKLVSMTRRPTSDELENVKPKPQPDTSEADLDPRCMTGRVMCVSKTTRHLTWVIDGVPQYGFDVRFGSDELPTREGVFTVYKKKKDVISNLYHTPMPYSMFFSGGQAVHYSSNFARLGYAGASHGCVNVRDWDGIVRLYGESRIGDTVVIHW